MYKIKKVDYIKSNNNIFYIEYAKKKKLRFNIDKNV